MILRIDEGSPLPPYEQLRQQVTALVASGVLAAGTRLPAIRQLAGDLGIAGGTVARAYRELEADGIVVARGRHGTVVADGAAAPARAGLLDAARRYAAEVQRLGGDVEEALAAVRAAYAASG